MDTEPLTIRAVLTRTTGHFQKGGIETARLDAEVLLAHALGCDRLALYLEHDKPLSEAELERYRAVVRRRARREPVAYITGTKEFYGRAFEVGPGVLVPRPDTEAIVDAAVSDLDGVEAPRVLDLGTGSGAILLSILAEVPGASGVGVDASGEALAYARRNADRLGLADRVRWLEGSWYEPLAPGIVFDRIVSNPPYVSSEEWEGLDPDIVSHEPRGALVAGEGGIADLRVIAAGAPGFLAPGGRIYVEIGYRQMEAVAALFRSVPDLEAVAVLPDLGRRDRVVRADAARRTAIGNHT